MNTRALRATCLLALAAALLLRTVWLTADPPVHGTVGIVWHDEGAWVHNARNRALWGVWRTDDWNPMFVAPVFTGLEYVAFAATGVGTWQARLVPVVSGLVAILALWWGLAAARDRRAAAVGVVLLSTSFFFVMWNRAALMESTLTMWLVVAWAAYARALERPAWGLLAGAATVLAFFTKASAAFFVAAIGLEAATVIALASVPAMRRWTDAPAPSPASVAAARFALAGLIAATLVAVITFVLPHWQEFRFYNWQMSVTRKPDYTLRAFMDRASWLPIVHDVFSRMWLVVLCAALALVAIVGRWWTTASAGRLLALWVLVGIAELIVHDSGNERRYVMFVPALVALTAWIASGRAAHESSQGVGATSPIARLLAVPAVLLVAYLVWGSAIRLVDVEAIYARDLAWAVRWSALLAAATAALAWWNWDDVQRGLTGRWSTPVLVALVGLVVVGDLAQFGYWAHTRTDLNYRASIEVGRALPDGALVHGKLANGLSLENRIRPVFVGRGFGNYADRFDRPDVPYMLTYILPRLAYEGDVMAEIVRAYPANRVLQIFPVNETPGEDLAALMAK